MTPLHIELDRKTADYCPGEAITGKIYWDLPVAPDAINFRLFWYTKGAGNRDIAIVHEDVYVSPLSKGNDDFHIQCPEGPHSFSGGSISLKWALELIARPGNEVERKKLTLSNCGSVIDLQSIRILENNHG